MDWRERLSAQLRDGSFHYVAVAQRFTPSVLRTLQYLNATMRSSRFSAVELIRFAGAGHAAFEARFVAGAQPAKGLPAARKNGLAGVEELLAVIIDDDYRHHLRDLFAGLAAIEGLTVFWGTAGCSLRVAVPDRSPLSIGWLFPPGPPRWMGLTDLTLGWYEDATGLVITDPGRAALDTYLSTLGALHGATKPKPGAIQGWTFAPAAVVTNAAELERAIRTLATALLEA